MSGDRKGDTGGRGSGFRTGVYADRGDELLYVDAAPAGSTPRHRRIPVQVNERVRRVLDDLALVRDVGADVGAV